MLPSPDSFPSVRKKSKMCMLSPNFVMPIFVMSCSTPMTLLINSSPVPSYLSCHSCKLHHAHPSLVTPTCVSSCSHDHWPAPALRHSQAQTLFTNHPSLSCNSMTHIFHSSISSSHILLCSNSDIHIMYCVITLTFSLLLTSHPHSC